MQGIMLFKRLNISIYVLSLFFVFIFFTVIAISQDFESEQSLIEAQYDNPDNIKEISCYNPDTVKSNKISDTSSHNFNSLVKFNPNNFTSMTISCIKNANMKIDGVLNEAEWKSITAYKNFCEVSPGDNTKPEVETEVKMFYDDDNLYFGFTCYESDISKLRNALCERDKMFSDDFCGFFLDTYNEGRQAYELFVNPEGVQGDLIWTTPGNEDASFDMIWYSAAKVYKDRWTVEIAVPFKSLRFPDKNIQNWQIHFLRIRPRENRYQYSLIAMSRDDPTLFTKAIKISGVKNIKGGKNIEILPYAISTQSGAISDNTNSDSKFVNDKIKGDFGLNLKYGITSNITADFSYNPDFSQVESDAGVITANNTYAFSYNEKR